MSSGAVRAAFRANLTAFCAAQVPPVPFVETIDVLAEPTDALFITASFFVVNRENNTCGLGIETGVCEVSVLADGGLGDADVIALADAVELHFGTNPNFDGVSVIATQPPTEATAGDGVRFYGVTVAIDYLTKL